MEDDRKRSVCVGACASTRFTGSVIAYGFIVGGVILLFNGALASGVILAFTGWFVLMGAQGSVQQLTLRQELAGVTVGQVMTRDVATVRAGATLAQLIDGTFPGP
jgi:hypothetical protein